MVFQILNEIGICTLDYIELSLIHSMMVSE